MCLAIPGKLIEKYDSEGSLFGKVAFGGITRQASLDFLPEAEVGDYVLVHVGFAISRIDEEEAHKTFAYMQEIGMLEEELGSGDQNTGALNSSTPDSYSLKLHDDTNAPRMATFPASNNEAAQ